MTGEFSIESKFRNPKCPFGCGDPIEKGERITKRGKAWGHVDCRQSVGAQRRQRFEDPHNVLSAGQTAGAVDENGMGWRNSSELAPADVENEWAEGEWEEPEPLPF